MERLVEAAIEESRSEDILRHLDEMGFQFPTPPFSDDDPKRIWRLSSLFSEYYMEIHNKTGRRKVNVKKILLPMRSAMVGDFRKFDSATYKGVTYMVTKWNHNQNFANPAYVGEVLEYFSQAMDIFINNIGNMLDLGQKHASERSAWLYAYLNAEMKLRADSLRLGVIEILRKDNGLEKENPLASVGKNTTAYPKIIPRSPSNMFEDFRGFVEKIQSYLTALTKDEEVRHLIEAFYEFVFEGAEFNKKAKFWPDEQKSRWKTARESHGDFISELKTSYPTIEILKSAMREMINQIIDIIRSKPGDILEKEDTIKRMVEGQYIRMEPYVSGAEDKEMQSLRENLDSLVF